MTTPHPAERTRELLRTIAENLVRTRDAWLADLAADSLTAAGMEAAAADPVLRAAAERAFQASFLHWATTNLHNPGDRVPPDLGEEIVHIARDLIRRGLEDTALAAYRAGQARAFRLVVNMAFECTREPDELEDLLDVATWSISDFVESTVSRIMDMMRDERAEILRGSQPELRETVALVLDGAPITVQRAESRLGYRLEQEHTAVVVWSAEPDDFGRVDDIVEIFGKRRRARPLTVIPGASTKWVWVPGTEDIDREQLRSAVDPSGSVRVAVGGRATGVEGFRRSHLDAIAAQRMVARLDSPQRVVFFDEVQLVALMTSDAEGADQFVRQILGDLAHASRDIRETVLAFIEENGSVRRVADRLYAHRNTVVRRVARAETLLPRPLAENPVPVAAALQVLRWTRPGA
ncbi:PucR family transcriptional regulator [Rhodococcus opacus]|uniref:PucR family transcriptional regulator n=1 Tax=Rhodococcus opacus TaxID=37919 RepID=UPI001C471347|nr:helix-turn-helix domain-containing protein [Rhodococcus opacus]MBV6762306.1 helix-turn-helix domain-containing protein [Rhodococcus opacus]